MAALALLGPFLEYPVATTVGYSLAVYTCYSLDKQVKVIHERGSDDLVSLYMAIGYVSSSLYLCLEGWVVRDAIGSIGQLTLVANIVMIGPLFTLSSVMRGLRLRKLVENGAGWFRKFAYDFIHSLPICLWCWAVIIAFKPEARGNFPLLTWCADHMYVLAGAGIVHMVWVLIQALVLKRKDAGDLVGDKVLANFLTTGFWLYVLFFYGNFPEATTVSALYTSGNALALALFCRLHWGTWKFWRYIRPPAAR